MYEPEVVDRARSLLARGESISAVAKQLGLDRSTVRDWRDRPGTAVRRVCHRCHGTPLAEDAYAYVLALYLGDGCISMGASGVARLRIVQTAVYTDLIQEAAEAVGAVLPNRVGRSQRPGCVEIGSYSKHWPCLIPQHAPGLKHHRRIELEPWQAEVVGRCVRPFLRGLIHSDGCRSINTIRRGEKAYRYPRYQFTNASEDILRLFTDWCEALGVRWTRTNARTVAVSRRTDVELLDEFIGPKS